MGRVILKLLQHFEGHVPDSESFARVIELAATPNRWLAAHGVFDQIRRRRLSAKLMHDASNPTALEWQRAFEELCCKAMYNCTSADDPFDSSSPFFVAGAAIKLAKALGMPLDDVAEILASLV
ncbi:MAG TPA: hypothetical protein VFW23_13915 [Tepidisphaeraceae bacterium]|nr:hypothetical protein [Tepidisphaeraceae bacterium]